jgi:hypothetical protein
MTTFMFYSHMLSIFKKTIDKLICELKCKNNFDELQQKLHSFIDYKTFDKIKNHKFKIF